MILVTWPIWPPRPYMVKPFKILLRNRGADFYETWYAALGTPAHHSLFKWWLWSEFDLFYGKVKFGNFCFFYRKKWKLDFSETIAACDLKVDRCRRLIEMMKVCEYWRSRSFHYHIFSRFCMFCALLGQDIRWAFTGPLVLWFFCLSIQRSNIYPIRENMCIWSKSSLSISPSINLFIYLSIFLFIYLSIYPSIFLFNDQTITYIPLWKICVLGRNRNTLYLSIFSSPQPKAHRWAYRIPMDQASVRPLSVVRPHFQTSSPPKPLGQSNLNFMWSLLGKGERKFI